METLESTMKKNNISLDTFFTSFGHALSSFGYSLNASYSSSSSSSSNEWVIDYVSSYHIAKDKAIFLDLNECNTKQFFVGVDSLAL